MVVAIVWRRVVGVYVRTVGTGDLKKGEGGKEGRKKGRAEEQLLAFVLQLVSK